MSAHLDALEREAQALRAAVEGQRLAEAKTLLSKLKVRSWRPYRRHSDERSGGTRGGRSPWISCCRSR